MGALLELPIQDVIETVHGGDPYAAPLDDRDRRAVHLSTPGARLVRSIMDEKPTTSGKDRCKAASGHSGTPKALNASRSFSLNVSLPGALSTRYDTETSGSLARRTESARSAYLARGSPGKGEEQDTAWIRPVNDKVRYPVRQGVGLTGTGAGDDK
jgi:hypothetical protein